MTGVQTCALPIYSGDGAAAGSAGLNTPSGVAVDSSGNIYIADSLSNVVRKITGSNISTVAGKFALGAGFSGDAAAATSAQLYTPYSIFIDGSNNLYISDTNNNRIRKVGSDGNINTIAGNGIPGFAGDGSDATKAKLNGPRGLWVNKAGEVFFADSGNNRIRKIGTDGKISTVAGTSSIGSFSGDGGLAINAGFNRVVDVKGDAAGNLYVSDSTNSRIRRINQIGRAHV